MKSITIKTNAYLSEYTNMTPQEVAADDGSKLAMWLHYGDKPFSSSNTLVGAATITVQVASADELVVSKIAALEAEEQQTLAEAQVKATRIRRQINELLAITMEPQS